jgi:type I restriction enzyme R subunit
MLTEQHLENLCLDWFRTGSYEYAYGPDISHDGDTPELNDYQQVILTGRLISSLQKINPHIPLETLEEAALAVTKPESLVLIHNNRAFHKLLLEGVSVEYTVGDEKKTDHVQLIDFQNVENNQFLVVNQFTLQGTRQLRRPDIVVFINGLPIAVIELKNPADMSAPTYGLRITSCRPIRKKYPICLYLTRHW